MSRTNTPDARLLLLRTHSTLRLIELTGEEQQRQLKHVTIALGLIERILIGVIDAPDSEFEAVVMSILDESLSVSLEAIDNAIP